MLTLIHSTEDLLSWRKKIPDDIGLVPTMGNLHQGHLFLVENSLKHHPTTVVTIFVNPKQFGPNEDFDRYPRTLEQDLELLKSLDHTSKQLIVFAPSVLDIYPPNYKTSIYVKDYSSLLCGKSRPHHFEGVTTVVYRLFQLVKPIKAYFGKKDYQQVFIIKKMVEDLILPLEIVPLETQRNSDGLALSSRNGFLNDQEKVQALTLTHTLLRLQSSFSKKKNWQDCLKEFNIEKTNGSSDPRWEYLEVLDKETLFPPGNESTGLVILGAFHVGKTRLIDNREVFF